MENTLAQTLVKVIFKVLILIVFSVNALANDIIRDSEIEHTLHIIADPVIRSAGLKPEQIEIYVINDDSINAFTPGSKEIYIHSGLIKNFSNPDVIRGVIAHELGHIVSGHMPSRSQRAEEYSMAAMSAMGIGLALSGVLNLGLTPGMAIALGGVHYAERSILHYSRVDESIADKSALRFLETSGYSSKGLIELMEKLYFENRSITKYMNPYDMTHPLSEARLSSIKNFYNSSKQRKSQNSQSLLNTYHRTQIKLQAFTGDYNVLLSQIENKNDDLSLYAKAIIFYRKSQKQEAIKYLDQLLNKYPEDPYYNELKGQILFEFGNIEALKYYNLAAQKLPNDNLLKLSHAIVKLNILKTEDENFKAIETSLRQVLITEHNNLTALYYLSIYYDKIGLKSKSQLSMAIFFAKKNDYPQAKIYAKQAIKGLKPDSPEWIQANDIIEFGN